MVDISTETWNEAGVSVIKIHENDDVNKTILLLLCISDAGKRCGCKIIYDLVNKEIKGKCGVKKMNRSRLIKDSKDSRDSIPIITQSRLSNP